MIKKWQPIYPSSKVSPNAIEEFGWKFIEEIPARINHTGCLSPVPEASDYLRALRAVIDEKPTIKLATVGGPIVIEDFAIARLFENTEQRLGFYALVLKEEA